MRIFNVYRGVKGFVSVYHTALRSAHMITPQALRKARILVFWEKHGITATLDAFSVRRSTLFLWKKQFIRGGKRAEALNEKKRTPRIRRKRLWPESIIIEIKRQRSLHPNIGKDKMRILLVPIAFNKELIPWLVGYHTERPHWGLDLKSPMQFMLTTHPEKSNMRWTDTHACREKLFLIHCTSMEMTTLEQLQTRSDLPRIKAGDTIRVHQKIKESGKERIAVFEGMVLACKHGAGITATITVRKVVDGIGVERVFPLHSPTISKIEVLRHSHVRRAKLYYIRDKANREIRKRMKQFWAEALPPRAVVKDAAEAPEMAESVATAE